jgi:hypothetical protein
MQKSPRNLFLAILGLSIVSTTSVTYADALSDLNNAFKDAYGLATTHTFSTLRASVPVLVNRFGQIALYRPGIDLPDLFSMDMKLYLEASAVAHSPAALFARLAPFGLGRLDDERLEWLTRYQSLLSAAEVEVKGRRDIPDELRAVQTGMLAEVRRFAQRIHQQGTIDQPILDELGSTVRSAIRKNLDFAAASQLDQFRGQIDRWRSAYSSLKWDNAVVVIIGMHQPRDRYLQRQFFDWLLRDQPNIQAQVVFAETMTPPPPLERETPTEALVLLSKVMLDKSLSNSILGDPLTLQSDVLGNAAEAIIKTWH